MRLSSIDWADVAERAFATALEAFLGAVPVSAMFDLDRAVLIAGALAGITAALSVVKNVLKQWLEARGE